MGGFGVESGKRKAAALALLIALAGCDAGGEIAAPDGSSLASREGHGGNPHARPEVFAPGVISDAREQWRITFTPDGGTAYFTVSDEFFPISRQGTIMVSHRVGRTWTTPVVASFSGRYSDIDPFITPDGSRLYFSSIRPVNGVVRGDLDLWMVERTARGSWSEPVRLGPEVNGPLDELYPSVDREGNLYFGSGPFAPGQGDWDIYRARPTRHGGYAPRERLSDAVNSAWWDFNPEISPDGKTLVFTSLDRPGGYGSGDLYVSHLHRGEWTPAKNLGPPVNTELDEYHPTVSPDRKHLYFVRHSYDPWIPGDFYTIPVAALGNRLRPGYTLPGAK